MKEDLLLMKTPVKIIVLIPVFNSELYLTKCLESLLNQTHSNWEAFIIDDASTDNSFQLVTHYAKKDSRIKAFLNEENKGPGYTRNLLIQYAQERKKQMNLKTQMEYVVFLDSDDWIENCYFESICNIVLKERPDVIFVDLLQENIKGNIIKKEKISRYKNKTKDIIIRHQMTGKLPWGGVRKVASLDLIIKNRIAYSNDSIGEEAMYSFKLLYHAEKISFLEKELYHYVIHLNSQSSKYHENPYEPIYIKLEEYLRKEKIYSIYEKTLKSFAYTALIVSIYRCSQYYDMRKALKLSVAKTKKFKREFGLNIDKDSLERRTRILIPFVRYNLAFFIVFISKTKNFFANFREKLTFGK